MKSKSNNIPEMTVGKMVSKLSDAYSKIINNGLPVSTMPSVMLWGPPGVGKSQAVRQIGKNIESNTKKTVKVTDVRLLLFNPIDLRGIPTANEDKTLAVWLKPQIFQMDPSESVINILFLDEISAAPQSVQAAAYQITLDRTVGEHRLPDNCIVMAAGNRVTDKSVAFKMPKALANRLMHIEVSGNFRSWKEWAVKTGLNEKVIGFLSEKSKYLMGFDSESDDLAFPTPRSWEMVSNILNGVNDNVEEMYDLISGIVGSQTASEFRTWAKFGKAIPNVEDIFDGKHPPIPKEPDALYALVSAMTAYASYHQDDYYRLSNSIRYAYSMPPDYSTLLMKNYMAIDKDYYKKLMVIPEFVTWLNKKGSVMNGTV